MTRVSTTLLSTPLLSIILLRSLGSPNSRKTGSTTWTLVIFHDGFCGSMNLPI
ncbi:hypothetical protein PF010_g32833 [Phytophthora fragariae]|uniref:RxLR effector protein n=1 Tax=Phytophthora fragariae TaxID=53985 RepID=A0A6G0JE98_9STRA|nr:hypothetical protein PF010_g32833 [Phytophthora fragariae]